eukprot:30414-Pelagococcus_subviridis.AAC.6
MRWLATVGTSGSTLLPTCIRFDSGPLSRSPLASSRRYRERIDASSNTPALYTACAVVGATSPPFVRADAAPKTHPAMKSDAKSFGLMRVFARTRRRRGGVQRRVRSGVVRRRGASGIETEG